MKITQWIHIYKIKLNSGKTICETEQKDKWKYDAQIYIKMTKKENQIYTCCNELECQEVWDLMVKRAHEL